MSAFGGKAGLPLMSHLIIYLSSTLDFWPKAEIDCRIRYPISLVTSHLHDVTLTLLLTTIRKSDRFVPSGGHNSSRDCSFEPSI
jgi:hypothetical protein